MRTALTSTTSQKNKRKQEVKDDNKQGFVIIEMSPCIARVQLRRSLNCAIPSGGRIKVDVILASEFADSIQGLFDIFSLRASLVDPNEPLKHLYVLNSTISVKNEISHMEIDAPELLGSYRMLFDAVAKSDSSTAGAEVATVLPLLTEVFEVVKHESVVSEPFLSSWRLIGDLCILEEYGKTLGSHIYDSSIIMLQYLAKAIPDLQTRRAAVELGSGCGLISIWLSKYYSFVLATDKSYQLPLIQNNIKYNQRGGNCFTMALDWTAWSAPARQEVFCCLEERRESAAVVCRDPSSAATIHERNEEKNENTKKEKKDHATIIEDYIIKCAGDSAVTNSTSMPITSTSEVDIDLIIGADVLYDQSAADAFFNVVRDLAIAGATTILIAQKVRKSDREGGDSLQRVNVRSVEGFIVSEVASEADVVIWSLVKL